MEEKNWRNEFFDNYSNFYKNLSYFLLKKIQKTIYTNEY